MKNHNLQKPNSSERLISLHFLLNNYICKNVMKKKFCVYVRVRARAHGCAHARLWRPVSFWVFSLTTYVRCVMLERG